MKLADWMELHGIDDTKMAKLVGVNQSTVNRIKHGEQEPRARTVARIEQVTKGQVSASDLFRN
jgi:DNA-binding transcriptional regulator YdaS (Cro superfamily)